MNTRMLSVILLLAVLFAVGSVLGQGRKAKAQKETSCAKDIDCPGDMLCRNGKCKSPSEEEAGQAPAPSPPPAPEPAPEPAREMEPAPAAAAGTWPPAAEEQSGPPVDDIGAPEIVGESPSGEAALSSEAPVNKANGGILTGLIIDIVGFGLFISGGAVVSLNLGVGLMLGYMGGMVVTVGSTVSTISFSVRHAAYVDAGFNPSGGRRAASWVLTGATLGSFGGGLAMGLVAGDSFGLAIGSICLNGTAVILEIVNFYSRQKWDLRLRESVAAPASSAVVMPAVFAAVDPATGRQTPVFGVAGAF